MAMHLSSLRSFMNYVITSVAWLGVLKLYVPHPLESSTWPPVILSILNLCCHMGDLMWPVEVNWKESVWI